MTEYSTDRGSVVTTMPASDQVSQLMLDHPGWFAWAKHGYAQRALRSSDTIWMLSCRRTETTFQPAIEVVHQGTTPANACPSVDTYDASTLPAPVRQALLPDLHPRVHRVRTPDVWDAMLMPIFLHRRGVVDAANLYRAFCARYGTTVTTELGTTLLPPRPETAATLDDDPQATGRRMPAIRAVADAYLRLNPDKAQLPPTTLYNLLQKLPHIGEGCAARIVADTTGNFSFYAQAGFGSTKHWRKHATETRTHGQETALQAHWRSCTHEQQSTVIALTTHKRLSTGPKAEAARINRWPWPRDRDSQRTPDRHLALVASHRQELSPQCMIRVSPSTRRQRSR